jgi:hypothetical protein
VSIADTSVTEGNSGPANATFTVTLNPVSSQVITAQFTTANGTATAGQDYTATSGTVTFQHGVASSTITVPILGDTTLEPDETFTVTLTTPAGGATIGRATATGTIKNDDHAPTFGIADTSVVEGNSGTTPATFTVTLDPASTQVTTVDFTTVSGTAIVGQDFTATSGTLTFQPGETSQTIAVQVTGDTTFEDNELFQVLLSNPTGGAVLGRAQAYGTIANVDAAGPCGPRPRVVQTVTPSGGTLQVHLASTLQNGGGSNSLSQVRVGTFQNATVTVNSQAVSSGQTITLPANAQTFDFTVAKVTAGQPAQVPFTVVDGCGDFPSFVGGGTGAGF